MMNRSPWRMMLMMMYGVRETIKCRHKNISPAQWQCCCWSHLMVQRDCTNIGSWHARSAVCDCTLLWHWHWHWHWHRIGIGTHRAQRFDWASVNTGVTKPKLVIYLDLSRALAWQRSSDAASRCVHAQQACSRRRAGRRRARSTRWLSRCITC